ncbi:MAG: protein kinase [Gemmatimonadota bacterium]|nr:MAG: protein kinase [Gemmatimonadota bacterium]
MIGETISHYKILEKLGEGGMGVVYKAEDTKLKRTVALKFLPPELTRDPEAKQRFIHEAQAASALDYSNICTIYEIDETGDNQLFISMACYGGQNLREKIEKGPLKLEETIDIGIQIAQGLSKAHEKGIVHRDIKPGNILITEDGQVKIVDFGLAKLRGRTKLTKTGTALGTVAYMSPEQSRGKEVDHRTDIWSLGVVLYEMLTGQMPFKGDYEQAVVYSILNEEPEPITNLRSDVPTELQQVMQKAMQKEPTERYASMAELLTDLKSMKKDLQIEDARSLAEKEKPLPSIAVLPFVNMSADPEQEYFCDGMSEELINALTKIENLRVPARTSAFAFKGEKIDVREIGRKLSVATVLEGSVRKAGNRLRIAAQLINVADGYHLWSERFDRELDDVFAIQDEISMAIVNNLKVRLLRDEEEKLVKRHTRDPEAYNLYLKGLYFSFKASPEGMEKVLQYFRKAIDKDPDFALTYTGVANVFLALGIFSLRPTKEILPKAKAALDKALHLDDTLAEAHANAALMAFWIEWDWRAAENHFKKALALNPRLASCRAWYAWYQLAMGRFDKAISELKRAQELDPLMPLWYSQGTGIHLTVGNLDEAMNQFHKAIELDPNFGLAYFHVGRVYFLKGMMEEAISAFKKMLGLTPYPGWAECYLGMIYHLQGKKENAENLLEEIIERKKKTYVSSVCIAILCHELGKLELAYEFYEKAIEERDILMPFIKVHPEHEKHRSDPQFKSLLKKMSLDK